MELEWGNRMQGVKDGAFEPRGERWAARRRCPLLQLQIGPVNKPPPAHPNQKMLLKIPPLQLQAPGAGAH